MNRTLAFIGLAALGVYGLPAPSLAQTYPARPVRIIVGFGSGGGVDMSARVMAKELTGVLGQSVVVENRPGAAGNIGADLVAKSAPDGHTLLMSNSTIAIPSLFIKLPYDVTKDLVPISLVAIGPTVLVVHPSVPARSVKELIALAKARPNQLIYGSGGIGNISHLQMELLMGEAGAKTIHVPYKGGGPSVIGLLSGEVHAVFSSIPSLLQQIKAGKVRALGISTLRRSPALPDVPTIDESAMRGFNAASWYGLFAPANTPKNVLGTLSGEAVKIMRSSEMKEKFAADGFEPVGSSPEEFSKFLNEEIAKWAKVVKMVGIKPE